MLGGGTVSTSWRSRTGWITSFLPQSGVALSTQVDKIIETAKTLKKTFDDSLSKTTGAKPKNSKRRISLGRIGLHGYEPPEDEEGRAAVKALFDYPSDEEQHNPNHNKNKKKKKKTKEVEQVRVEDGVKIITFI